MAVARESDSLDRRGQLKEYVDRSNIRFERAKQPDSRQSPVLFLICRLWRQAGAEPIPPRWFTLCIQGKGTTTTLLGSCTIYIHRTDRFECDLDAAASADSGESTRLQPRHFRTFLKVEVHPSRRFSSQDTILSPRPPYTFPQNQLDCWSSAWRHRGQNPGGIPLHTTMSTFRPA
jgi:hypothetical protein